MSANHDNNMSAQNQKKKGREILYNCEYVRRSRKCDCRVGHRQREEWGKNGSEVQQSLGEQSGMKLLVYSLYVCISEKKKE